MAKMVNLTINTAKVTVPEGTVIVDAAKLAGIDIPVFCYHPKMEPVGMCRQCLVEIGRPMLDRATGQPVLNDDGTPKVQFGPKLETSCTTPVTEGMVVISDSAKARLAMTLSISSTESRITEFTPVFSVKTVLPGSDSR